MGTLFDQSARESCHVNELDLEIFIKNAIDLSRGSKITVSEVIEAKKVLELERRNNLAKRNGDAFDEQMAGLGTLLQNLITAIEE